jgi:MFS transporter, ACS family, glucarate transporter
MAHDNPALADAPEGPPATDAVVATRIRYIVLAVGCSLALLIYVHRQSFVRGQTEIQTDLALDDRQMGYLASAFLLAYGIFQVPCGLFGDRLGARHLLTLVVLGSSVTTAATALAPHFPAGIWPFAYLLAARFLFGAFQAGTFPVWARVVADWTPFSERGSAQGIIWMCSRLGGALSPFVFFWLFQLSHSWTIPFVIVGAAGLLWAAAFWLWFRNRPEEMPRVNAAERALIAAGRPVEPVGSISIPWSRFLSSANVWALCLQYGFVGFAGNFITSLLPAYLDRHRHVSPEANNWVSGLPLALGIVSCALGGFLSDWITRRWGSRKWGRRFVGAAGLSLAGLTILAIPGAQPVWLLGALFGAWFFFNDLNMGPAWAACADVGERSAGTLSGAMNMIGQFFGATGMSFAGWMMHSGHDEAMFVIFAVSYALAAACWLAVDVTKPLAVEQNHVTL